jgi:hypothetical protein
MIAVLPQENGTHILRVSVDPAWLSERFGAGDVVVIDPTLAVSSGAITGSGKREAILSDGTRYLVAYATGAKVHVSKDNGANWTQVASFTGPASGAPVVLWPDTDDVLWFVYEAANGAALTVQRWVPSADRLSLTGVGTTAATIAAATTGTTYQTPRIIGTGAAGATKTVWVAWSTFTGTSARTVQSRSFTATTAGVITLGSTVTISTNASNGATGFSLSQTASGTVYAGWIAGLGTTFVNRIVDASTAEQSFTVPANTSAIAGAHGLSDARWVVGLSVVSRTGVLSTFPANTYDTANPESLAAVGAPAQNAIAIVGKRGSAVSNSTYPGLWLVDASSGTATDKGAIETTVANNAVGIHSVNAPCTTQVPFVFANTGGVYSDTASLNQAPTAPTGITIANFDTTTGARLTYTHNDPDGNAQTAQQLQFVRVDTGATVLDTGKLATVNQFYDIAANALTQSKQYQVRVMTWDTSDAASPWSSYATFYTSAKPTAAITYPASDGAVVGASTFTAQGTISDPESEGSSAWQFVLTDNADVVLWDGGKMPFAFTPSQNVAYTLSNGGSYKLKMTGWDAKGVPSVQVVRTFTVSYTPVNAATTGALGMNDLGRINVTWTNPATGPAVAYVDLYRRENGGAWTRIATNLAANSSYYDYNVASGVAYDYKATAIGTNGSAVDSATASATITFSSGVWLHDPNNAAATAYFFQYRDVNLSDEQKVVSGDFKFVGRTAPVVNFDATMSERTIKLRVHTLTGTNDRATLEGFLYSRRTICLRDFRGRKVFGVLRTLPSTDERYGRYIDVELTATAFTEVV